MECKESGTLADSWEESKTRHSTDDMVLKQIFTVSSRKDSKQVDAPLNMSLMIVPKYNIVWFLLEKETVVEQETSKNAFKFLMENSSKHKKLEKSLL